MKNSALLFDLDGTLFNSAALSIKTFQKTIQTLIANSLYPTVEIPDSRIIENIGMRTVKDIFKNLLPEASSNVIKLASDILEQNELKMMSEFGSLFPKVEETLNNLKRKGYNLFVASNGSETYVTHAIELYNLTPLFKEIYCAGKQRTNSKVDLVKIIKNEHPFERYIMIGDRSSDMEAGKNNQIQTIGCVFGMDQGNELSKADYKAYTFSEIEEAIKQIESN
ncbi:HAD family hydrolase [Bacillus sp. AFS055030]|uniref:HAD family hydrolase n=1 Tax=Bacillus sp. AFS055030 TaxID=2033507 RepID=UPI0015D4FB32|nr:HAD family hydrolase [Bacillus sp. AFS055030]